MRRYDKSAGSSAKKMARWRSAALSADYFRDTRYERSADAAAFVAASARCAFVADMMPPAPCATRLAALCRAASPPMMRLRYIRVQRRATR